MNIWNYNLGRHYATFLIGETSEENKTKLFGAWAGVKDETEYRRLISFLVPEKTFQGPCPDAVGSFIS